MEEKCVKGLNPATYCDIRYHILFFLVKRIKNASNVISMILIS